jgi:hypothetical protein
LAVKKNQETFRIEGRKCRILFIFIIIMSAAPHRLLGHYGHWAEYLILGRSFSRRLFRAQPVKVRDQRSPHQNKTVGGGQLGNGRHPLPFHARLVAAIKF